MNKMALTSEGAVACEEAVTVLNSSVGILKKARAVYNNDAEIKKQLMYTIKMLSEIASKL